MALKSVGQERDDPLAHFARAYSAVIMTCILGAMGYFYLQFGDMHDKVTKLEAELPYRFQVVTDNIMNLDKRVTTLEKGGDTGDASLSRRRTP